MQHFDVIVIGSGPGGEGAAMTLSKQGKHVALVEQHHQVGGGCTHWGTIPSKALRHAVQLLADYRHHPLFEHTLGNVDITYPQLLKTADSVTSKQVSMRHRFYVRNHVEIFHGKALFVSENQVKVLTESGAHEQITADNFVIATGSSPYHPADVNFDGKHVVDSDTVLALDSTPRVITIYGAGVIGCEYASIFANLDVKVNLVNTRDSLLSFLDDEITDALSYHLRDQGVMIRHNENYDAVEVVDDGVILHGKSGRKLKSDVLLWANGRSGNTGDMGLEDIGIALNNRGQIEVNDTFQSNLTHIYAVGDVIGPPGLASASYDQGRFAALHIAHGEKECSLIEDIPTGIYTSPEISSQGKPEIQLTEEQVPYELGRAEFKNLARAQITGHTVGMLKILFHRETLEILGIHCFGEEAAEIIHIGQAIMRQHNGGNNLNYFIETTFNYPTMAEAYRVAALNGINRNF